MSVVVLTWFQIPTQVVICKDKNVHFANHLIEIFNKNLLPVVSRLKLKNGRNVKRDKMYLSTCKLTLIKYI